MVSVHIEDAGCRESLARFLDVNFGGSIYDRDDGLELRFHGREPAARVQLRIVERLLWAWSRSQSFTETIEVGLTATTGEAADAPGGTVREEVRLRP